MKSPRGETQGLWPFHNLQRGITYLLAHSTNMILTISLQGRQWRYLQYLLWAKLQQHFPDEVSVPIFTPKPVIWLTYTLESIYIDVIIPYQSIVIDAV
jgi:hypothetical protein